MSFSLCWEMVFIITQSRPVKVQLFHFAGTNEAYHNTTLASKLLFFFFAFTVTGCNTTMAIDCSLPRWTVVITSTMTNHSSATITRHSKPDRDWISSHTLKWRSRGLSESDTQHLKSLDVGLFF